ncbi:protein of unknown function [Roseateles sp. YR242]|uniref:DUF4832 domain-containing protein n=1 Tax=Roseateles sp. YR242 TaxID=1855305 RepID=UPI0008B7FC51|nr:DUF4832 domain-containing protein [Roseateles sp. YR242]SEL78718.1 protein of unknown function [Roseateles sp. YR242]
MPLTDVKNRHWPWLCRVTAMCVISVLAACGGGGSGSSDASTPVGADPSAPVASTPSTGTGTGTGTGSGTGTGTGTDTSTNQRSLSFTATDAEIPNPERGFYRWAWTNLDALTAADAQDAYNNGYRLVYAPLNLSSWKTTDLPASLLTQLTTAFANARASGIKLVIRAVYNYPASETEYLNAQDASLTRVQGHISQLKPVLQANADVIAYVQAGFIGAWGEWHTSSNQLTTTANRTAVRDALLAAVPTNRFIQVRYPPYVMDWTPTLPSLASVLTGSYRVGVHNDCFLASATDVGTYDENATTQAKQRAYVSQLGDLAPFGGETCDPADESNAVPRTTCDDILTEGERYRLTYLNDEYYRDLFHTRWIQNGCMPEVKRKMGYRLQLVSASHPTTATRGQALTMTVTVRNTGWARMFNPRGVQVLLRDSAGTVRRLTADGADPRSWVPGADQTATLTATVPADLAVGTYALWLALPDGDTRLANDARYSVRVANADDTTTGQKWDATLGAFALGASLEVK